MKIAILSQSYPPMISGAALFSCHLAEYLADRGHEVLVMAASNQRKPYCQQRGNLKIVRMRSYSNPLRVGQRFLLWPAIEVRTALNEFTPDVIHLNDPFQLSNFALTYAHQAGIPCILTIHALPNLVSVLAPDIPGIQQLIEKMLWEYASWLIRQFDVEITPTATISKIVSERTGMQSHVISGGVDLQIFHPDPLPLTHEAQLRTKLGVLPDSKIILHVGRLDGDKNVKMIIRVVASIINRDFSKKIDLVVVGDGREKQNLIQLAESLGLVERCHFTGYVIDPILLSNIYRLADVFVMASEVETQGLVLLEAAACGLPIVAVNATAVHEIVTDGVNGFLVSPRDEVLFAKRVELVLRDPVISSNFGSASRQASLIHDFNRTVDAYEACYLSITNNRQFKLGSE